MKAYIVWDDDNSSEEFAERVEAMSPDDAAVKYAEEDSDGHTDGLYTGPGWREVGDLRRQGHPLMVREDVPGAVAEKYLVGVVEFIPRYGVVRDDSGAGGAS